MDMTATARRIGVACAAALSSAALAGPAQLAAAAPASTPHPAPHHRVRHHAKAPAPRPVLWSHPGVYVAWGLANGQFTPDQLAATMATQGFTWIALQATPDNAAYGAALATAAAAHGLRYGIWEVPQSAEQAVADVQAYRATFYIANVEGAFDDAAFVSGFRQALPTMDAALVTNFGGIDNRAEAAPWIAGHFAVQPEAYQNDNPQATPAAQDFQARQRGWSHSYPVIGIYDGYAGSNYTAELRPFGGGWSAYLAEEMTPADFQALQPDIPKATAAGPHL